MGFVPLHNHSDYSLLDGASQLPLMVARAKELGFPALALTDHGVMYGAIELLKLCKKEITVWDPFGSIRQNHKLPFSLLWSFYGIYRTEKSDHNEDRHLLIKRL